jgi:4-hydroxy-2-oxoheptanedioate aldolase
VVAVQVETAEGLANIEAIAAVDGIDLIFVGPGDLSVSIDATGPAGADKLNAAIKTIIGATVAHGRTAGIFCASPQNVSRWAAIGASFFVLASDTMFLGAGTAANCTAARAELG